MNETYYNIPVEKGGYLLMENNVPTLLLNLTYVEALSLVERTAFFEKSKLSTMNKNPYIEYSIRQNEDSIELISTSNDSYFWSNVDVISKFNLLPIKKLKSTIPVPPSLPSLRNSM